MKSEPDLNSANSNGLNGYDNGVSPVTNGFKENGPTVNGHGLTESPGSVQTQETELSTETKFMKTESELHLEKSKTEVHCNGIKEESVDMFSVVKDEDKDECRQEEGGDDKEKTKSTRNQSCDKIDENPHQKTQGRVLTGEIG